MDLSWILKFYESRKHTKRFIYAITLCFYVIIYNSEMSIFMWFSGNNRRNSRKFTYIFCVAVSYLRM